MNKNTLLGAAGFVIIAICFGWMMLSGWNLKSDYYKDRTATITAKRIGSYEHKGSTYPSYHFSLKWREGNVTYTNEESVSENQYYTLNVNDVIHDRIEDKTKNLGASFGFMVFIGLIGVVMMSISFTNSFYNNY